MVLSFYMYMLINVLIMQISCLSPTRTCRPLADRRSVGVVLAAVSGRNAARPPGSRVSQMFPSLW